MRKKIEIALVALFTILFLKTTFFVGEEGHVWMGGSELLLRTIGGLLVLFYFPIPFLMYRVIGIKSALPISLPTEFTAADKLVAFVTGLGYSLILIGLRYKFMLWEGDRWLIGLGLAMVVFGYFYARLKNRILLQMMTYRSMFFLVLGLSFGIIQSYTFERFRYREYPRYVEALDSFLMDQSNDTLHFNLQLERYRVLTPPEEFNEVSEYLHNEFESGQKKGY